jgi:hypothetical protein
MPGNQTFTGRQSGANSDEIRRWPWLARSSHAAPLNIWALRDKGSVESYSIQYEWLPTGVNCQARPAKKAVNQKRGCVGVVEPTCAEGRKDDPRALAWKRAESRISTKQILQNPKRLQLPFLFSLYFRSNMITPALSRSGRFTSRPVCRFYACLSYFGLQVYADRESSTLRPVSLRLIRGNAAVPQGCRFSVF